MSTSAPPAFTVKPQIERELVRAALLEFYQTHNASRISSIDTIVDSYLGKEVELLEDLKKRYKVDFEPFNKIIAGIHLEDNVPHGTVLVAEGVVDQEQQQDTKQSTPPPASTKSMIDQLPNLSSRGSILGIPGIQSLFTEKIMNGVNTWKGFQQSSTSTENAKKDYTEDNDELPDQPEYVAMLLAMGHPEEVIVQLQHTAEINARMERQLKQALHRLDFKYMSQKSSMSRAPRRASESISHDVLDLEPDYKTIFAGRSEESLMMEICSLRDLLADMRDFSLETLRYKTHRVVASTSIPVSQAQSVEVSNAESSTEVVTLDITADDTTLVTPEIDGTPSSKEIANILPMNQLVTSPVDAAMQRMIDVCERLVPPWSEMDELRKKVNELSADLRSARRSLQQQAVSAEERNEAIASLKDEVSQLKKALSQAQQLRNELSEVTEERIRAMEACCLQHARDLQERFQLEREDALSHLVSVAETQQAWQAALTQEVQTEIVRLRIELAKSRRQESQREREVAYLQRQLTEAAKQLAQYVMESESAERGIE